MTVLFCKHVKERVLKGGKEAFLVNIEDASACQVSNALGVLALQRREADHVKRLEDVRRVRRHTESQDLMFKAVVFKILVKVALIAV